MLSMNARGGQLHNSIWDVISLFGMSALIRFVCFCDGLVLFVLLSVDSSIGIHTSMQEECEASGRCSDRDYYTVIHSKDPVNVQYGICLVTGEYVGDERPSCGSLNLFDTMFVEGK